MLPGPFMQLFLEQLETHSHKEDTESFYPSSGHFYTSSESYLPFDVL